MFGNEDPDACTVNHAHPNDLGFYRMAQHICPILHNMPKNPLDDNIGWVFVCLAQIRARPTGYKHQWCKNLEMLCKKDVMN